MSSEFFATNELSCKCGCNECLMDRTFMGKLDAIREAVNKPFPVTSAYRCPDHNDNVSGTGRGGPHTTGRAIDIKAAGRMKFEIMEAAKSQGMTRFGIGREFIHIDDLSEEDGFDGDVVWTY